MGAIFECTIVISFKEDAKQGSSSRIFIKKYDHVSDYYKRLHWLPLNQFIKFRSVCSMYKQFHQGRCIPLEPQIQFGQSHSHHTRTSSFARIVRYNLNFSQRFFRNRVTQWWTELFTISVCQSLLQYFC